jgi:MFS family permease
LLVRNLASFWHMLIPAERTGRRYAIMRMVDAIGNGLFLSGVVVFALKIIRIHPQQISLSFSAAGVVSMMVSGTASKLVDRLGAKRTLLIANLIGGLSCLGFCLVHSFLMFLLLTCADWALAFWASIALASYVSSIADEQEGVRLRAQARSLLNAGFGAGAALAAGALAVGTTAAYYALPIGDAVSFFVVAILVMPMPAYHLAGRDDEERPIATLPAKRNLPFLAATALDSILRMPVTLMLLIVPLWIVVRTSAPRPLIGALIVGNTVAAALFQVWASSGTESLATSVRKVRLAAVLMLPACLAVALSGRTAAILAILLLIAGYALFTGAEVFQAAGAWGILYGLVPPAAISDYAGVFNMSNAAQTILGPGIAGWLVLRYGLTGWIILAAVILTAAALQGTAVSRAALLLERRASAHPEPVGLSRP